MSARTIRTPLLLALTLLAAGCTLASDEQVNDETEVGVAARIATTGSCELADKTSDPKHCGTCGNVCGSGICSASVCMDASAGHVFVIGNGYATSNGALDKALGNAVFLNERKPVRVLAYAGTAPAALITGTNAAINRYATARGRTWAKTAITSSADVAIHIDNTDVFLVYAQPQLSSQYLDALGDEWSLRLDNFTRRGGIIIVLDTPSTNVGTPEVLVRSGLLQLTGRTSTGAVSYIGAAEDVGAARVPLMFASAGSVGWTPSSWTNVASSDTGQAVIIHRAID